MVIEFILVGLSGKDRTFGAINCLLYFSHQIYKEQERRRLLLRETMLIKFLLNQKGPVKRSDIAGFMNLSESSIRDLIANINISSKEYGVEIKFLKGKGYVVIILDQKELKYFLNKHSQTVDMYNPESRTNILLGYLLQSSTYITIGHLAEKLMLSRSTVIRDLEVVEETLRSCNLQLVRRPHHGIKIEGNEQDLRKAISKYVIHAQLQLEIAKDYRNFLKEISDEQLGEQLFSILAENSLNISDVAFNNILAHLKILLFRVKQNNFITNVQISTLEVEDLFYRIANKINTFLKSNYDVELPKIEIQYLAAHISTRINVVPEDKAEKNKLHDELSEILETVDKEFLTYFHNDNELIEALLLHMYPLLKRLYFNIQLQNPIIEEIYVNYTNVFVVACRFAELIQLNFGFDLTKDEIGYIALHFAAHFERTRNRYLENVKRIVVICSTGQGSANLLKLKLESVFPKAHIMTTSQINLSQFKNNLPDLFLSTLPLLEDFYDVPVIHIKEFLDEDELRRIKEIIALHVSEQPVPSPHVLNLKSLFKKELFIKTDEKDYLEIIKKQAQEMIEIGYAPQEFKSLVIERELKMPTIYKNTVAGPHPIKLIGTTDTIGVSILEKPIEWEGRLFQIIFLINLRPGHLFLHKEISRLLLYYIDNEEARRRLVSCSTFEEFLYEIERIT